MEILETKGRKMNKIKREEREDLHTFSDTTCAIKGDRKLCNYLNNKPLQFYSFLLIIRATKNIMRNKKNIIRNAMIFN